MIWQLLISHPHIHRDPSSPPNLPYLRAIRRFRPPIHHQLYESRYLRSHVTCPMAEHHRE